MARPGKARCTSSVEATLVSSCIRDIFSATSVVFYSLSLAYLMMASWQPAGLPKPVQAVPDVAVPSHTRPTGAQMCRRNPANSVPPGAAVVWEAGNLIPTQRRRTSICFAASSKVHWLIVVSFISNVLQPSCLGLLDITNNHHN